MKGKRERASTSYIKLITYLPYRIMISGSSVIVILKNKMMEARFQSLLYSAHEGIQKEKNLAKQSRRRSIIYEGKSVT